MINTDDNRWGFWLIAIVVIATVAVYWPVHQFEFINLDDPDYVVNNVRIHPGLTGDGIAWAFTQSHSANWHPLTWLSHMADIELYGLNPGGHHITNLTFHILNTLLLFYVLYRMTKKSWLSALTTGLFALHPLHVESVAWISERKDVLSTFFWLLTMAAYIGYVRRKSKSWYIGSVLLMALGLMAKPMLVTLPFVLLLIDYWPLDRLDKTTWRKRLIEKIPFFALSVASSIITVIVQKSSGAVTGTSYLPLGYRLANAVLSYSRYIYKTIWPAKLAIFYPHPVGDIPILPVILSAAVLIAITAFVVLRIRKDKYLLTGWLWYLGTLVPVIGIVQVGSQALADRYTYVPLIGVFVIVAWAGRQLTEKIKIKPLYAGLASMVILAVCSTVTYSQVKTFQNSQTLFNHALTVTENNYEAHFQLGMALEEQGQFEQALDHYQKAIKIKPDHLKSLNGMGVLLVKMEQLDEAIEYLEKAKDVAPNFAQPYVNLAVIYLQKGQYQKAIDHYVEAQKYEDHPIIYGYLGYAYLQRGQFAQAEAALQKAVQYYPNEPQFQFHLGMVMKNTGRPERARIYFRKTLELNPNFNEAAQQLKNLPGSP